MQKELGPAALGDRVLDRVTGYEGVVVSITDYLFGNRRIQIQKQACDEHGQPLETVWLDDAQAQVVERGIMEVAPPNDRRPKQAEY
jgi:hypothetical protein